MCKRQKVDCFKKNPPILLKLWTECAIFLVVETNVCIGDTKRGEQTLKEDKNFFIVDKSVLPEEGKNSTGCGEPCGYQPQCFL